MFSSENVNAILNQCQKMIESKDFSSISKTAYLEIKKSILTVMTKSPERAGRQKARYLYAKTTIAARTLPQLQSLQTAQEFTDSIEYLNKAKDTLHEAHVALFDIYLRGIKKDYVVDDKNFSNACESLQNISGEKNVIEAIHMVINFVENNAWDNKFFKLITPLFELAKPSQEINDALGKLEECIEPRALKAYLQKQHPPLAPPETVINEKDQPSAPPETVRNPANLASAPLMTVTNLATLPSAPPATERKTAAKAVRKESLTFEQKEHLRKTHDAILRAVLIDDRRNDIDAALDILRELHPAPKDFHQALISDQKFLENKKYDPNGIALKKINVVIASLASNNQSTVTTTVKPPIDTSQLLYRDLLPPTEMKSTEKISDEKSGLYPDLLPPTATPDVPTTERNYEDAGTVYSHPIQSASKIEALKNQLPSVAKDDLNNTSSQEEKSDPAPTRQASHKPLPG